MQPQLYDDSLHEWLEANGTTVGHLTDNNRHSSFIDMNKLKTAIEELINYRISENSSTPT
jgi:hypothetical protein